MGTVINIWNPTLGRLKRIDISSSTFGQEIGIDPSTIPHVSTSNLQDGLIELGEAIDNLTLEFKVAGENIGEGKMVYDSSATEIMLLDAHKVALYDYAVTGFTILGGNLGDLLPVFTAVNKVSVYPTGGLVDKGRYYLGTSPGSITSDPDSIPFGDAIYSLGQAQGTTHFRFIPEFRLIR